MLIYLNIAIYSAKMDPAEYPSTNAFQLIITIIVMIASRASNPHTIICFVFLFIIKIFNYVKLIDISR